MDKQVIWRGSFRLPEETDKEMRLFVKEANDLLRKMRRVFNSCKTPEHWDAANRFADLAKTHISLEVKKKLKDYYENKEDDWGLIYHDILSAEDQFRNRADRMLKEQKEIFHRINSRKRILLEFIESSAPGCTKLVCIISPR